MVKRVVKRSVFAAATVVLMEVAYAVLKPAPVLRAFDPSGQFGDPDDPQLRVAVLGDSSVTAPGVDGPHQIWVSLVCEWLARSRYVVLRSFAVGGSRARDVIAGQLDDALEFDPDLVFLAVGANDVLKGVSGRRFRRDLDEIVARLTVSGASVVQGGVGVMGTIPRLHPPLSHMLSRRAERFDRIHRQVAKRYGTEVVDHRHDDVNVWHRDRSLWAADQFHVSAAGHARWARTTWDTVGTLRALASAEN